jgi:hypothetical protein
VIAANTAAAWQDCRSRGKAEAETAEQVDVSEAGSHRGRAAADTVGATALDHRTCTTGRHGVHHVRHAAGAVRASRRAVAGTQHSGRVGDDTLGQVAGDSLVSGGCPGPGGW